jgi:hypothetical protein
VLGVGLAAWFAVGDDLARYFDLFDAGLARLEVGLEL